MKKISSIASVIGLTVIFTIIICYVLSQNNAVEIPYKYLEF
jgi:hypothetical protein